MQAVATQGDYIRFQPLCQANFETFFKKKNENLSYSLTTIPYAKLLYSPHIRRNSPSRGISLPNSLTDFFEHSCSRQPMKAPKFLMGLVATLAVGVRFELTERSSRSNDFKSFALNHSATPPIHGDYRI